MGNSRILEDDEEQPRELWDGRQGEAQCNTRKYVNAAADFDAIQYYIALRLVVPQSVVVLVFYPQPEAAQSHTNTSINRTLEAALLCFVEW